MLQYTTVSSCRQDFLMLMYRAFFSITNLMLLEKSVSSYCYRNIKLNCSFTLLWPCIRYAFNLNVWVVWSGGTHRCTTCKLCISRLWAGICMWILRDLRVSLLFSDYFISPPFLFCAISTWYCAFLFLFWPWLTWYPGSLHSRWFVALAKISTCLSSCA